MKQFHNVTVFFVTYNWKSHPVFCSDLQIGRTPDDRGTHMRFREEGAYWTDVYRYNSRQYVAVAKGKHETMPDPTQLVYLQASDGTPLNVEPRPKSWLRRVVRMLWPG